MKYDRNKLYLFLLFTAIAISLTGINLDFFTDDPALYASISKNLLYRNQLWELFTYNQDWLDKPHFPFWAIAISFKIFGISVWAYRLPAFLFFLLGLRYTYLFTKRYYNIDIAWIATLILATSLQVEMSNTDVRAEPYLLALVIGSIYHISKIENQFSFKDILLAALLTALAIMTKGIFVIVAIYGALAGQLIFKRRFSDIFKLKWLVLGLITAIFILPELYALYIQFDLHPEKIVFGRQHVSGIKWFFWDSQFGRFVNNGPITRPSGDILFYVHTLLWAFAPWCLLFYYAIYKNIRRIIARKHLAEYYTFSGGILLLLLFSLSGFQLPFYTNTIFPLFAIITAPYCYEELSKTGTIFRSFALWVYIVAFPALIILINYFGKPGYTPLFFVELLIFGIAAMIICFQAQEKRLTTLFLACLTSMFANLYLNTIFNKMVIGYRAQITAANYVNQTALNQYKIYNLGTENNIFQFYVNRQIDMLYFESFDKIKSGDKVLFFANQKTLNLLRTEHKYYTLVKAFPNYKYEQILPGFINQNTRSKVIDSVYLLSK